MCTLALYFREFENLPLIVAANRDEQLSRPSAPPRLLNEKPRVFGGKDLVAGGTWLGVNEHGLMAAIVNRRAETASAARRSRGLLCLDLLKARDPSAALDLLKREKGSLYQPFNLLFADAEEAFASYNQDDEIKAVRLDPGLHVLSNTALFDLKSEKLEHAHKLLSQDRSSLRARLDLFKDESRRSPPARLPSFVCLLQGILSDHAVPGSSGEPKGAICVHAGDYGTLSSSIVMIARTEKRFYFYHAPAAPCRAEFEATPPFKIL